MKILIVTKDKNYTLSKICKKVKNPNLKFSYVWKNTFSKKDVKNSDLVIAIGGDGTALSASHYLEKTPILIVNSNPKKSIGALATIPLKDLPKKINEIEDRKEETEFFDIYTS